MTIHHYAQFFNNPYLVHERAVRHIVNYLAITSTYVDLPDGNLRLTTRRLVYRHDVEKFIEYYVDAEFAGGWEQAGADYAENVMSSTGYVITYVGCPVIWFSNSQT